MPEKEFDPRKAGKLHYHADNVQPVKVDPKNMVHKNPLNDLYHIKERKHKARDIDLPLRTIQLHVGDLDIGGSTRLHRHHNEAAIYIIKGKGYSIIQGKRYDWETGDFLYIPTFCWHIHYNTGDEIAYFLGITNKKLLDWLGLDRKQEAGIHVSMEEVEAELKKDEYSPYSWYSIDPENGVKFGL